MPALPARGRVVARAPRRVCRRRGDAGCPRRLRQSAPPTRRTKAEPGLDRPTARFAPWRATVVAMDNGSAVRGHHRARNAAAIGPRGASAVPNAGRKQRRCADHRNSRGRLRVGNHRSGSTPHLAQRGRAHRGRPDPGECLRARRSLRTDRTGSAGHPGRARRGAGRTPPGQSWRFCACACLPARKWRAGQRLQPTAVHSSGRSWSCCACRRHIFVPM